MTASGSIRALALGAALLAISVSCGSHTAGTAPQPQRLAALPSLPQDAYVDPAVIRSRGAAALGELRYQGSDVFQLSQQSAQLDTTDHTCTLSPGAGEMSWAVYQCPNLLASDNVIVGVVMLAGEQRGAPYFVGVANFATGRYEFGTSFAASPEASLALPAGAISPAGNVYIAVVAYDAQPLTVSSLALQLDCADPPPQGFSAEDGDGQAVPVHLSWSDPAVSFDPDGPGPQTFDYLGVRIQRAETVQGPWTDVGTFQPGTTEYYDQGALGNPPDGGYYYHVMTLITGSNLQRWGGTIYAPLLNVFLQSLTARFALSPAYGNPGTSVAFDGTGTDLAGATLTRARWDFDGDGVWDETSATSLSTTHVYGTSGRYYPKLEVTVDDAGAAHTDTVTGCYPCGDQRGDWSEGGRNCQHANGSPLRGPRANTVRGSYLSSSRVYAPVVGGDGKVYVCDAAGYLRVLNADASVDHSVDLLGGSSTLPPALDKVGNVWLNVDNGGVAQLTCVWADGSVHTYDAAGMYGAPTVTPDGKYMLCAGDKFLYEATPVPASDDIAWWHHKIGLTTLQYRPAVSRDGTIYSYSREGQMSLSKFTPAFVPVFTVKAVSTIVGGAEPVIPNSGYIYAGAGLTWGITALFSANAAGALGKGVVIADNSYPQRPAFAVDGTPYICTGNNHLYTYDTVDNWPAKTYTFVGEKPLTSPLVDGDGKAYVITTTGTLRCFSRTLKLLWSYDLGAVPDHPGLALGNDGTLYAGGTFKLVAFK